ncbi:MAG: hypothetical protein IH899_10330 [Planctomycetes bacterium]|nr:hypothetical protein [Planctomycetota bacterium]
MRPGHLTQSTAGQASRGTRRLTPAMQAGVVDQLWTFEDLFDEVMF